MVYDDESTEIAVRLVPDSIPLDNRMCIFFWGPWRLDVIQMSRMERL
jgi:hypothetical protein